MNIACHVFAVFDISNEILKQMVAYIIIRLSD